MNNKSFRQGALSPDRSAVVHLGTAKQAQNDHTEQTIKGSILTENRIKTDRKNYTITSVRTRKKSKCPTKTDH